MKDKIKKLEKIFKEMVSNTGRRGETWRNISLGKKAFELMKELPAAYPEEFDTPEAKAAILSQMLDQMEESYTPRFCIQVREYIENLDPNDESNKKELARLRDYIDLSLPMPEYCKKYRQHLKFDPVERTEKMEMVIEDVERECAEKLKSMPRGMGFCFAYWSVRRDVLAKHGIEWKSPSSMNPRVMFD